MFKTIINKIYIKKTTVGVNTYQNYWLFLTPTVVSDTYAYISLFTSFSYQFWLVAFYWSFEWQQVSSGLQWLLNILADLNNIMVSILLISNSSSFFSRPLRDCSKCTNYTWYYHHLFQLSRILLLLLLQNLTEILKVLFTWITRLTRLTDISYHLLFFLNCILCTFCSWINCQIFER